MTDPTAEPADKPSTEVVRDANGRWLVPPRGGRTKGSSQADLVRKLIEPKREELITRAFELTKSTDPHAAGSALRILLERLAPQPKHESEHISVPGLAEAATFTAKCECVITAVAGGEISAEAGERVLRLLNVYRLAVHHDEVVDRLAAVEAQLKRAQDGRTVEPAPSADDLA